MKRINYTLIILILFLFPIYVDAASLTFKASSSSIVKGGTVTITATISDSAAIFFTEGTLTCTGAGVNKSTSMSWDNTDNSKKNKSFTLSVTTKDVGTITCKTSGVKFTGGSSSGWSNLSSKPITIEVKKPREKSTNNNLKSLSVEGYSISPSFNKNTLEYTVNLESNVEKIMINASKEDGYAGVSGTGEKEVQEGDNKIEIIVTSETGKSKVYTVNAIVKDSNPIVKDIEGKSYTVIKRASALTGPDGFEDVVVTINDFEIPAFYNEITNITLVGLKDGEGSIYLYKYDAKTDNYTKYESLTSVSKTIIFDSSNEEIEGFTKKKVTIDNIEYDAYQHVNNKDYLLIYGIDLETGNKDWYLYNIKDESIQSYMSDVIDSLNDDFSKQLEEYKLVLIGMVGLSLFLLLIIIIQIVSKNKLKNKLLKKIQIQKEIMDNVKKEDFKVEDKDNKVEQDIKNTTNTQKKNKKNK